MVVSGRVTIFGEYLMHGSAEGLIVPSRLALATADEFGVQPHGDYRAERDWVRLHLSRMGLPVQTGIRGELPLGHGFAGSTALTLVHLNGWAAADIAAVAGRIDHILHGFPPSGVDFAAVVAGAPGLFTAGLWQPMPSVRIPDLSAVLVPAPGRFPLSATRERVLAVRERLAGPARHLCARLRRTDEIDYEGLLEYAVRLQAVGVYTRQATAVVGLFLACDVVAKCVGGLTNKAVIVVWPPQMGREARLELLRKVSRLAPDRVYGEA
jgi:hypothetical protein